MIKIINNNKVDRIILVFFFNKMELILLFYIFLILFDSFVKNIPYNPAILGYFN